MAESIVWFLNFFGLLRERDELRRRVGEAVKDTKESGVLTRAEYLRENGLGEDERQKGKLRAAYTRFSNLLARIEALPEGTAVDRRSYVHCQTLGWMARCLKSGGQPAAAEQRLREALTMIDALIKQQPENQSYIRERGVNLTDLADVLRDQASTRRRERRMKRG